MPTPPVNPITLPALCMTAIEKSNAPSERSEPRPRISAARLWLSQTVEAAATQGGLRNLHLAPHYLSRADRAQFGAESVAVDSRTKLAAGAATENHAIASRNTARRGTGMTVVSTVAELSPGWGRAPLKSTLTRLVSVPTSVVLLTMVTVTPCPLVSVPILQTQTPAVCVNTPKVEVAETRMRLVASRVHHHIGGRGGP